MLHPIYKSPSQSRLRDRVPPILPVGKARRGGSSQSYISKEQRSPNSKIGGTPRDMANFHNTYVFPPRSIPIHLRRHFLVFRKLANIAAGRRF